jgi:hypothetical protein
LQAFNEQTVRLDIAFLKQCVGLSNGAVNLAARRPADTAADFQPRLLLIHTHLHRFGPARARLPVQVGSEERQNLESRLRSEVNKLKVLIYCLQLQLLNTCSKKQLAAMCVHSHPFCFDAAAICQAAAELLEQQQQRQQENCSNV